MLQKLKSTTLLQHYSLGSAVASSQMAWTRWRVWLERSTFPNQTRPCRISARRLASERDKKNKKKPASQRKLGFWGCFTATERQGVKRLVVSAASAMSSAWVSVSCYTIAKLVKGDLCIRLLITFTLFFFPPSPYFHIWLTQRPSAESSNARLISLHFVAKWLPSW